jgi:hypothetical protein
VSSRRPSSGEDGREVAEHLEVAVHDRATAVPKSVSSDTSDKDGLCSHLLSGGRDGLSSFGLLASSQFVEEELASRSISPLGALALSVRLGACSGRELVPAGFPPCRANVSLQLTRGSWTKRRW